MHVLKKHHRHFHTQQYTILLLLMLTCFFAFVKSTGNASAQFQIGAVMALTYLLWGVFHHLYDRDLHWKIVIEYASIALLGITIMWTLLSNVY